MKRVLVDTGPLVAICNRSDRHHLKAATTLVETKAQFVVPLPVLIEATYVMRQPLQRDRLQALLEEELLTLALDDAWPEITAAALTWMRHYAEHQPDFVDAFLVAWAERDSSCSIWTLDSEFRNTWRTSRGRSLRLL